MTVNGIPWKAMVMFGAAAGPVRNKVELQRLFEIITDRLQRLYDVALRSITLTWLPPAVAEMVGHSTEMRCRWNK